MPLQNTENNVEEQLETVSAPPQGLILGKN